MAYIVLIGTLNLVTHSLSDFTEISKAFGTSQRVCFFGVIQSVIKFVDVDCSRPPHYGVGVVFPLIKFYGWIVLETR